MQNEIKSPDRLLDEKGNLKHIGYSKSLLLNYDRKDIKAGKSRIKEWDYYLIYNDKVGVALTIADNGYMGLIGASILDFSERKEHTKNVMTLFPFGKYNMPSTSKSGDIAFNNKNIQLEFKITENKRILKFHMNKFNQKDNFDCELELDCEPKESMCIATPFKKDKHFYYNQKIVGFKVKGSVKVGGRVEKFAERNTRAILDWGRGVWTYKNTWYWGAATGIVEGHEFGFNIGYGFGDTSGATENMLFYDGVAHKIENVAFNIPKNEKGKEEYLKPWTFTSSDNRFEMNFEPILDRASNTDILIIGSDQHQVFGYFSGVARLDDGKEIKIHKFLGFAEKVMNKW